MAPKKKGPPTPIDSVDFRRAVQVVEGQILTPEWNQRQPCLQNFDTALCGMTDPERRPDSRKALLKLLRQRKGTLSRRLRDIRKVREAGGHIPDADILPLAVFPEICDSLERLRLILRHVFKHPELIGEVELLGIRRVHSAVLERLMNMRYTDEERAPFVQQTKIRGGNPRLSHGGLSEPQVKALLEELTFQQCVLECVNRKNTATLVRDRMKVPRVQSRKTVDRVTSRISSHVKPLLRDSTPDYSPDEQLVIHEDRPDATGMLISRSHMKNILGRTPDGEREGLRRALYYAYLNLSRALPNPRNLETPFQNGIHRRALRDVRKQRLRELGLWVPEPSDPFIRSFYVDRSPAGESPVYYPDYELIGAPGTHERDAYVRNFRRVACARNLLLAGLDPKDLHDELARLYDEGDYRHIHELLADLQAGAVGSG